MTHYQLTFVTDNGARRTFRVNNVAPGVPLPEMQAAVELLLEHDIMAPDRGALDRLQALTVNTVLSESLLP